jgi:hypothetical protein
MAAMKSPTMQYVDPIVAEPVAPSVLPATTPEPEVVPLPYILRQIGRDSQRDPQLYLDETLVPFGGE